MHTVLTAANHSILIGEGQKLIKRVFEFHNKCCSSSVGCNYFEEVKLHKWIYKPKINVFMPMKCNYMIIIEKI